MDGTSDRCHRTPLFARDTGLLHTLLTLETSEEVAGPLKVEDNAGRGPLDMAVRFSGRVYLFELKVVEQAGPGRTIQKSRLPGINPRYGPVIDHFSAPWGMDERLVSHQPGLLDGPAGPGAALAQLKARGYADKYRARGEPIYLVGVEFSRKSRNVTAFDTEAA